MEFLFFFIIFIFSLLIHRYVHLWLAYIFGDTDLKNQNNLQLNLFKNIDFFGTILLPLFLISLKQNKIYFGYTKPLKINAYHFKKHHIIILISSAILINLLLGYLLFKSAEILKPIWLSNAFKAAGYANVTFAVLHLIPIPPSDLAKILLLFLPSKFLYYYRFAEKYQLHIWVLFFALNFFNRIISIPANAIIYLFIKIL